MREGLYLVDYDELNRGRWLGRFLVEGSVVDDGCCKIDGDDNEANEASEARG